MIGFRRVRRVLALFWRRPRLDSGSRQMRRRRTGAEQEGLDGASVVCHHCGKGHFTDIEPIMNTPCCDYCGRDVVSLPGRLPGFDNAGTIPGTTRKKGLGEDAPKLP
jgi:hypothetical protein